MKTSSASTKFAVRDSDGYLTINETSFDRLVDLEDATLFDDRASAEQAAADCSERPGEYRVVAVSIGIADDQFAAARYHRAGALRGQYGEFSWTAWANLFDTEEEAQAFASALNDRDGIDPDRDETVYVARRIENDAEIRKEIV